MLKTLNISTMNRVDPIMLALSKIRGGSTIATTITHAPGIYEPLHYPHNGDSWLTDNGIALGESLYEYGVSDTPEQIMEFYRGLVSSGVQYIITLTKVTKSEEPAEGGWRWHKWGPYIGTKTPCHEYIYDEGPEIDEVYCYSVHKLKENRDE